MRPLLAVGAGVQAIVLLVASYLSFLSISTMLDGPTTEFLNTPLSWAVHTWLAAQPLALAPLTLQVFAAVGRGDGRGVGRALGLTLLLVVGCLVLVAVLNHVDPAY